MGIDKNKLSTEELPPTLYHYTSQNGLLGIVKSKQIYLTDIRFLNDAMEYEYTIKLIREMISKRLKELPKPKRFVPRIALISGQVVAENRSDPKPLTFDEQKYELLDMFSNVILELDWNVFVFSLSNEDNLLSQWRGYCPDGSGFSLGFDTTYLSSLLSDSQFKLERCIYKKNKQEDILNQFIDKMIQELKIEFEKQSAETDVIGNSAINFINIASKLKSICFEDEEEWRLISPPVRSNSKKIKFREGKSMIIPYISLNLTRKEEPIPINHIIIGPTPHEEQSKKSINLLLSSQGITSCKVSLSGIPYRTW